MSVTTDKKLRFIKKGFNSVDDAIAYSTQGQGGRVVFDSNHKAIVVDGVKYGGGGGGGTMWMTINSVDTDSVPDTNLLGIYVQDWGNPINNHGMISLKRGSFITGRDELINFFRAGVLVIVDFLQDAIREWKPDYNFVGVDSRNSIIKNSQFVVPLSGRLNFHPSDYPFFEGQLLRTFDPNRPHLFYVTIDDSDNMWWILLDDHACRQLVTGINAATGVASGIDVSSSEMTPDLTSYTLGLKLATANVRGGIRIGYTEPSDGSSKAVKLSGEKAYVDVTKATDAALGSIKTGFEQVGSKYPVQLDVEDRAFVEHILTPTTKIYKVDSGVIAVWGENGVKFKVFSVTDTVSGEGGYIMRTQDFKVNQDVSKNWVVDRNISWHIDHDMATNECIHICAFNASEGGTLYHMDIIDESGQYTGSYLLGFVGDTGRVTIDGIFSIFTTLPSTFTFRGQEGVITSESSYYLVPPTGFRGVIRITKAIISLTSGNNIQVYSGTTSYGLCAIADNPNYYPNAGYENMSTYSVTELTGHPYVSATHNMQSPILTREGEEYIMYKKGVFAPVHMNAFIDLDGVDLSPYIGNYILVDNGTITGVINPEDIAGITEARNDESYGIWTDTIAQNPNIINPVPAGTPIYKDQKRSIIAPTGSVGAEPNETVLDTRLENPTITAGDMVAYNNVTIGNLTIKKGEKIAAGNFLEDIIRRMITLVRYPSHATTPAITTSISAATVSNGAYVLEGTIFDPPTFKGLSDAGSFDTLNFTEGANADINPNPSRTITITHTRNSGFMNASGTVYPNGATTDQAVDSNGAVTHTPSGGKLHPSLGTNKMTATFKLNYGIPTRNPVTNSGASTTQRGGWHDGAWVDDIDYAHEPGANDTAIWSAGVANGTNRPYTVYCIRPIYTNFPVSNAVAAEKQFDTKVRTFTATAACVEGRNTTPLNAYTLAGPTAFEVEGATGQYTTFWIPTGGNITFQFWNSLTRVWDTAAYTNLGTEEINGYQYKKICTPTNDHAAATYRIVISGGNYWQ